MNTGLTCIGVLREPAHSPGRIDDDAAIMRQRRRSFDGAGLQGRIGRPPTPWLKRPRPTSSSCASAGPFLIAWRGWRRRARSWSIRRPPFATPIATAWSSFSRAIACSAPDQLGRRHRREQAPAGRLRLDQALRFPRDATRRRHVRRLRYRLARGFAPFRRARHSVRRRAGACARATSSNSTACGMARRARTPIGSSGSIIGTRACWVMSFDPARLSEAAFDAAGALGLEVFGGDAVIKADGDANDHRPQCVAELRALPRPRRRGDRRLPDRALPAAPSFGRLSKELIS